MKITTKGQVTIPQSIRERFGFLPHTEVDFEVREGVVVLTKARGESMRGRATVKAIEGRGDVAMSTEEILALTRAEPSE